MTSHSLPSRVVYHAKARVGPEDLAAEFAYHADRLRRHRLAAHGWGILTGLGFAQPAPAELVVEQGVAIDGYGRELVLTAPAAVDPTVFFGMASLELDLWLVRQTDRSTAPALPGASKAAPGAALLYTRATGAAADPTSPPGVPEPDRDFAAWDPSPADDQVWPVFLGRVVHDPAAQPSFRADTGARIYSGLRAERIEAPSGNASLELGTVEGSPDGRFAVRIGDERPLVVDSDGAVSLNGDLAIGGDLQVGTGLAFTPPVPAANDPAPEEFALYRRDDTKLTLALPEGGSFVVGAFRQGNFQPILSVVDEGPAGTVRIDGRLVEGPPPPPRAGTAPGLSTDAEAAAAGSAMAGVLAAAGNTIVGAAVDPAAVAQAIVGALRSDQALLDEFIDAVPNLTPDQQTALRAALASSPPN